MNKSPFRILKLKSGDDIIARLVGNKKDKIKYLKQVCIYGFNLHQLKKFYSLRNRGTLEKIEDIELLRFLDLNINVKMVKVSKRSISVDVKEDIKKVEKFLKQ